MFELIDDFSRLSQKEEEIIDFWNKHQIFQKSLKLRENAPRFVFYEGPPTTNGYPHAGHVIGRSIKDLIPRYKTMSGYYVPRKAGWDTHGLPVELEVEKELGISGKPEIEKHGIEKFNQKCKDSAKKYIKEWENLTRRLGIWMDLEDPYITYNNSYIETLWWVLKNLWERDLLYQGYKVLPYCARCGTSLSSHEVALGYRETQDPSVYIKFQLEGEEKTYFLVWTTTPWTLVANVALAVGEELSYVLVEDNQSKERYILNRERFQALLAQDENYRVIKECSGKQLTGKRYRPLLPFLRAERGYQVLPADFVSLDEGTGIVHIAPAFGEDDLKLAQEHDLPVLHPVKEDGTYRDEVTPWKGMWVKDADRLIIQHLKAEGKLFRQESYRHSYPFCWRCDTPLLYYAKESWFIRTTAFKELLIQNNQKVNWVPAHIKNGRFGNFLENMVDWALSRERYWGTPLNIWECSQCGYQDAVGSIQELTNRSREKVEEIELHRPWVDRVTLICPKCSGVMNRRPEVIDCWFDSGAMFVAQHHYPFENQAQFKESFPADFICEAIDQTRGWFYSLHVLGGLLFQSPTFKNCLVTELGLDEKGQKMSKHIGNVVSPWELIDTYGADVLRWYVFSVSPPWVPKRFGIQPLKEIFSRFFNTLWNVFNFFAMYANIDQFDPYKRNFDLSQTKDVFDQWIYSRLESLIQRVRKELDALEVSKAAKAIETFVVEDLSNWYIRRSRRRFWKSGWDEDKEAAFSTLYQILHKLSLLLAPFIPFTSELLYQRLNQTNPDKRESVHLEDYPQVQSRLINANLETSMEIARTLANLGRSIRNKTNLKLRQPLKRAQLIVPKEEERKEVARFAELIKEELNVKNIEWLETLPPEVEIKLKPNFAVLGPKYGSKVKDLTRFLSSLSRDRILRFLEEEKLEVDIFQEETILSLEEVEVSLSAFSELSVESEKGYAVVMDTSLDPQLEKEGLVRDLIHTIQIFRKEANFEIDDRVILYVLDGTDPEVKALIQDFLDLIRDEVLAREIIFTPDGEGVILKKEEKVGNKKIRIALKK